jgi:hypothetical protein
VLTVSSGHSADYLLSAVATGRENYYTGAVAAGEPPGRWYGNGAESLGLRGLVDHQDMTALYERFIDPRDEAFKDPNRWAEASTLGHVGRRYASEDELYAAALDTEPHASPERRAELRLEAGKRARRNVAFLDATFSVQKSITVLHTAFEAQEVAAATAAAEADQAGDQAHAAAARRTSESWATHKAAVEDAIWAGNRTALDYLADRAGYSRIGHHGGAAGRYIDAHDWTVASFFQHDSRNHDPQLHVHNAILNRVQGSDGEWRTLDGRALYAHRGAAAAVAERTTEEHLTRALGVRFATRPDGKAREIVGVPPEVMELFSSRRRAITGHTANLVNAFEAKFNREPNALELDRLQRQATFATRRAKSHEGESVEERLDRWDHELHAEVAGGLAQVADAVLDRRQVLDPERWSRQAVIETALADVQATKAAWTAPDLARAISDALPDHLGPLDGAKVSRLLDGLTSEALELAVPLDADRPGDEALPKALRLADGRSAYDAPGRQRYATPTHLRSERLLRASTAEQTAPALPRIRADEFVADLAEHGIELGADQAAAVRGVLTSGTTVESLVGPAGTGKSFVVGALAKAWQDPALWEGQERHVVGLASSQIAAEVLAGEGLDARNITRWLAAQKRLEEGRPSADDQGWWLHSGDLVVVDESAMANTADLAEIHQHVTASGAKLLLTGDHRQLAAVGAGGGMALVADAGGAYELAEARRFHHPWEREASLRLRAADDSVLGEYHKHGRLVDGGALEQAEASGARAWLADTLAGRHALLIVDSNEQAGRLSAQLRADLVRHGRVAEDGVPLGLQGTYAGQGDLVQARRNGWHLAGYEGNRRGPINREQYRVIDTREDGGLVVAPILGRGNREQLGEHMSLPSAYVAEHVALGYASTVHAAQGLTVDTTHAVITQHTGAEALYVGMSRGRHANTAHVTTLAVPADAPTGAVGEAVHRAPAAVLAGAFETTEPERSALATAVESAQKAGSVRTPAELFADANDLATAGRTSRWLDQLVDDGYLSDDDRARIAAEDGGPTLSRLLRRAELAGHDPRQVLTDAVADRTLAGARQLTHVIHHRINADVSLDPQGDSFHDWTPQVDDPQWRQYLSTLANDAETRRRELGEQALAAPPQWAVEALGTPPSGDDRADWARKAGTVAAHRELSAHDDPVSALGAAPEPGQVEAYASWRAAWRALGRPEADRDEVEMSDGQLRVRIRAHERERTWAPRYVANELAGTIQAAEQQRNTAELRASEAQNTRDATRRADLEREAQDARGLADLLDQRAVELSAADDARAQWLAHTAETRAATDRARAELSARRADDGREEHRITAEEWLAEHDSAQRAEDPHREIHDEYELADLSAERDQDTAAASQSRAPAELERPAEKATEVTDVKAEATETRTDGGPVTAANRQHENPDVRAQTAAESNEPDPAPDNDTEPDIRNVASAEPKQTDEDVVRVPTAEETAATIARAQRALVEIQRREAVDRRRETNEARATQLSRWHADETAEHSRNAEHNTPTRDAVAIGD